MAGELFIGLMSGTSLDGVDVALVEFGTAQAPQVIHTHFLAYPISLRLQILALQHPATNELETTMLMGNTLAQLYADAVNQLLTSHQIAAENIIAIGCHGQTIRHRPGFSDGIGFTLQIGNAALLAELTGITVISDFRSRDIAAGGQGAPLVPAFHQAVFGHNRLNRIIANIGGIANLTYLPSNGDVIGFDTGPGNMLMDGWISRHQNKPYDANGDWAATGNIIEPLLESLLSHEYFKLAPPKSTGRDLFNMQWLDTYLANHVSESMADQPQPQDVERTLLEYTAVSLYDAIERYCQPCDEIYLCGGGAYNTLLVHRLQALMETVKIQSTNALGIDESYVEAVAFAWLAKQCLEKKSSNLPKVTGAKGERILGAIFYQ